MSNANIYDLRPQASLPNAIALDLYGALLLEEIERAGARGDTARAARLRDMAQSTSADVDPLDPDATFGGGVGGALPGDAYNTVSDDLTGFAPPAATGAAPPASPDGGGAPSLGPGSENSPGNALAPPAHQMDGLRARLADGSTSSLAQDTPPSYGGDTQGSLRDTLRSIVRNA